MERKNVEWGGYMRASMYKEGEVDETRSIECVGAWTHTHTHGMLDVHKCAEKREMVRVCEALGIIDLLKVQCVC